MIGGRQKKGREMWWPGLAGGEKERSYTLTGRTSSKPAHLVRKEKKRKKSPLFSNRHKGRGGRLGQVSRFNQKKKERRPHFPRGREKKYFANRGLAVPGEGGKKGGAHSFHSFTFEKRKDDNWGGSPQLAEKEKNESSSTKRGEKKERDSLHVV